MCTAPLLDHCDRKLRFHDHVLIEEKMFEYYHLRFFAGFLSRIGVEIMHLNGLFRRHHSWLLAGVSTATAAVLYFYTRQRYLQAGTRTHTARRLSCLYTIKT